MDDTFIHLTAEEHMDDLMDYSDSKVTPREKVWVVLYYKSKEMNG